MPLAPQIIRSLMFEHFRSGSSQQVLGVVNEVAKLAIAKGLVSLPAGSSPSHLRALGHANQDFVPDYVQQVMWQLLAQGVLVWGLNATANNAYPFYRLTDYGKSVVQQVAPQPYDPDGFIAEFDRLVTPSDAVLRDYLVEAVRAFNANCFKSSAVMLGAASEQAVLLLHAAFEAAITDGERRAKFAKDSKGIAISKKYAALLDRLNLMLKKLPFELSETVSNELPAAFSFIRRCRNDAGHPEIPTNTDPDTVFLNLRVFTEYARRVTAMTEFFKSNAADW